MTLTFVETPLFSRLLAECVEDTDYRAFQNDLLEDPERGDLLVGCRGLRKARMAFANHGKSGGARVIYLLLLFKKSDTANLSRSPRNQLALLVDQIKSEYAKKRHRS